MYGCVNIHVSHAIVCVHTGKYALLVLSQHALSSGLKGVGIEFVFNCVPFFLLKDEQIE